MSILPTCFPKCVSIPHKANKISFSTLNLFSTSLNKCVFFFNNFSAFLALESVALLLTYVTVSSKNSGCLRSYLITCSRNFTFLKATSIVFCEIPFFKAFFLYEVSQVSKSVSKVAAKTELKIKTLNKNNKVIILEKNDISFYYHMRFDLTIFFRFRLLQNCLYVPKQYALQLNRLIRYFSYFL